MEKWVKQRRSELLAKTTDAETIAGQVLSRLGIEYIRQQPIFTGRSWFFADIYIPALRLILEIDGGYHDTTTQKRLDANRSACIRRLGLHVYRLNNHDARNPAKLYAKISRLTRSSR